VTSVSDLMELDVRELAAVLPEPSSLAPHEWLSLASALATKIIEEGGRFGPDEWAAASRAELRALAAAEAAGGIDEREHLIRRINLTAALLDRVGADDLPIRNPQAALQLVFDHLPVSLDDARRLAPRWRELAISDIRRLRNAKNLLTPALMINRHARDPRVDAWSEVYPQLP
jgi:hypothetical protein